MFLVLTALLTACSGACNQDQEDKQKFLFMSSFAPEHAVQGYVYCEHIFTFKLYLSFIAHRTIIAVAFCSWHFS